MNVDKRMVLRHTTGRYTGLHKITGTFQQLGANLPLNSLPIRICNVDLIDHSGDAVLERVEERYIQYAEASEPPKETIDDGA